MRHDEFEIGGEFTCGGRTWRCTDKGTRVVVAIRVDGMDRATKHSDGRIDVDAVGRGEAEREGWFDGPPYAVLEHVFDEDSQLACELRPDAESRT